MQVGKKLSLMEIEMTYLIGFGIALLIAFILVQNKQFRALAARVSHTVGHYLKTVLNLIEIYDPNKKD